MSTIIGKCDWCGGSLTNGHRCSKIPPLIPDKVEPVIDKSMLKRLVTQVFGEGYQIIKQEPVARQNIELIDAVSTLLRNCSHDRAVWTNNEMARMVVEFCREHFQRKAEPVAIPADIVMVPRKVTPEIEAVYKNDTGAYQTAQELHDAMIAAAPKEAGK